VTIVDNLVRAMPALAQEAQALRGRDEKSLKKIVSAFDNKKNLTQSLKKIRGGVS
jgi:4-phosphopantoate--beta-alanine ligase